MKHHIGIGSFVAAFLALSVSQAWPFQCPSVLYSLVNDPAGASIVSMCVGFTGEISGTVETATEGKGLAGVTGPGQPAVGSLFSSDSVFVSGKYLFTVNAGSNTVSMFNLDPAAPMYPKLVGKPADTLGEFPMSVTYSSKINTACVLNGGAVAGVTCFSADPVEGLQALDKAPRSISQGLKQTTPPVGPFSTTSDIVFNPSSSALIVSVKGNPTTKPVTPGYIFAWSVSDGKVSTDTVATSLPTVILDFSLSFLGNDFDLLITDPAIGAHVLGVSSTLKVTDLLPIKVVYQKAICWSQYDRQSETVFLIDAASANITVVSAVDGSVVDTIDYSGDGAIDTTLIGTSLYTLTEAATVINFQFAGVGDGQRARVVQTFKPAVANPKKIPSYLSGLAAYKPNFL